MGTYTLSKVLLPDGLDEFGLHYGLVRFENETLDHFRRRIYLELHSPSGASKDEFFTSLSRKVGLLDTPVFEIELLLDASGEPLAPDPMIQVTSAKLYAWSDYANQTLDFEATLEDRSAEYFLRDIKTLFDASTFFSLTVLDTDYTYKKSAMLAIGDTVRQNIGYPLQGRLVHDLPHNYLTNALFSNQTIFRTEVSTLGDLDETGEYFIDYTNGVVFIDDPASGYVSYEYRAFPYRLVHQAVRTFEFKDADIDHLIKDELYDEYGVSTPMQLNSRGAKIIDELMNVHPMEWGE